MKIPKECLAFRVVKCNWNPKIHSGEIVEVFGYSYKQLQGAIPLYSSTIEYKYNEAAMNHLGFCSEGEGFCFDLDELEPITEAAKDFLTICQAGLYEKL